MADLPTVAEFVELVHRMDIACARADAVVNRDLDHEAHRATKAVETAYAEALAEAARLRAEHDGGEWGVQYGHETREIGWMWEPRGINYATSQRTTWIGPPELVKHPMPTETIHSGLPAGSGQTSSEVNKPMEANQ